jgi:hypothetical protein
VHSVFSTYWGSTQLPHLLHKPEWPLPPWVYVPKVYACFLTARLQPLLEPDLSSGAGTISPHTPCVCSVCVGALKAGHKSSAGTQLPPGEKKKSEQARQLHLLLLTCLVGSSLPHASLITEGGLPHSPPVPLAIHMHPRAPESTQCIEPPGPSPPPWTHRQGPQGRQ